MKKIVQILSGGMDSVTLLYYLRSQGHEVHCLTFDYGQRHVREVELAKRICGELKVSWHRVDVHSVGELLRGSALMGDAEVPLGHYREPSMRITVVPNRNMIMLSIAIAHASVLGATEVAYGAHAGDHDIYPDCRPEFVEKLSAVAQISDYNPVRVIAPFIKMSKGDIAKLGNTLRVPFEKTWTCYQGLENHCGECGACVERKEAMKFSGMQEPDGFYDK